MLLDYVKLVKAKQNFKIKDKFEFHSFDDITPEIITEETPVPEQIEIFASVKIFYEGTLPDSYKTINLLISDWVTDHTKELTDVVHAHLKGHFQTLYPQSDTSEFDGSEETAIWEDQLEYMPRIDEKEKSIIIEIELVLEAEPQDE
jgi:hypothetical protein